MQTNFKRKLWKNKYGNINEVTATIKFSEGDLMELLRLCEQDNIGWSKGLAKEIKDALNPNAWTKTKYYMCKKCKTRVRRTKDKKNYVCMNCSTIYREE